jgi:3-oxoacyl-[acyl-carrier-protein] synthase-3
MGLPMERVFLNLDKYGNTSAASAAIALDEAQEQGRLKQGDKLLMVAFGGGLTWASCAIEW